MSACASEVSSLILPGFQSQPFLMVRSGLPENGEPLVGDARFEGYCVDLNRRLSDMIGYKYVLRLVKDGRYGSPDKNATDGWNGMMGELIRNVSPLRPGPQVYS